MRTQATLPTFKTRGAGYESVYYGLNKTRPPWQKEHIEIMKNMKFGVDRAIIEQDKAIQNLENL